MAECAACTAPTGDDGLLCRSHTRELDQDLRDVGNLVEELDVTLTRQDRVAARYSAGRSAEKPLVWNEHAATKRSELWSTLGAWALDVSRIDEDERDRLADVGTYDIAGTAGWIARNLSTLRRHSDAGAAFDEITDAIRGARRAIDRPEVATRFYAGPCPEPIEAENEYGVVETAACDGEVWAFIPTEAEKLAFLRCRACDAKWDTTQWLRVGRRMRARIEQLRAVARSA